MSDELDAEFQGGGLADDQSIEPTLAQIPLDAAEQPLINDDSETKNTEEEEVKENGDEEDQHEDTAVNTSAVVADFEASDDEDENADDTVNVIIKPTGKGGIYKTGTTYQARSAAHAPQLTKPSRQGIELDDPGNINGVPTMEFNLSSLGEEEKPWKRPGADITDYFNYGFTEETWIQYCEKQRILRQEYANATLKPVLATGGTGLLQRLRNNSLISTGLKHQTHPVGSINVVNSTGLLGDRTTNSLLLGGTDVAERLLNSGAGASAGAGGVQFSQPPPGYLSAAGNQLQQGATAAFAIPPPSAQLLAGAAAAAAAGAGSLFPLPPPVLGGIGQAAGGWPGVLGATDSHATIIDPITGQLVAASGMLDHVNRSPESVYSNENRHVSRRNRRHHSPDDGPYFDRSTYRARRRSRSSSREYHHSRHRRHHDTGRSDRESEHRRSGAARHGHRSRDERRYSGQPEDQELADGVEGAAVMEEGASRRGDRFSRSDSRRVRRHHSRSRSGSRRRDRDRAYRMNPSQPGRSSRKAPAADPGTAASSQADPLSIAAAAAANISAAVLGTGDNGQVVKGS